MINRQMDPSPEEIREAATTLRNYLDRIVDLGSSDQSPNTPAKTIGDRPAALRALAVLQRSGWLSAS
jgi:hypothetical protein